MTKIIAFGSSELMDGFALLGIETYADASHDKIAEVLAGLARNRERALVYLEQHLMQADIPIIARLRSQGGNILLCEIPNLRNVDKYRPQVETLIGRVLGTSVLERQLGN